MGSTPQNLPEVAENWRRMSELRHEVLLVCGAVLAISLIAVLWFVVNNKRRQRHSRHHGRSHHFGMNPGAKSREPALAMPHRRKWRRRRREHRPRNPTLAETGGLPPIRPDGHGNTGP
jgi:hypothetical protein